MKKGVVDRLGNSGRQKLFKDKGTVSNRFRPCKVRCRVTHHRSSAAPGEEGWGVSIRGSVSKNKVEPLLIIDGVPASGVSEMAQLNADDIETINFLKDARLPFMVQKRQVV